MVGCIPASRASIIYSGFDVVPIPKQGQEDKVEATEDGQGIQKKEQAEMTLTG